MYRWIALHDYEPGDEGRACSTSDDLYEDEDQAKVDAINFCYTLGLDTYIVIEQHIDGTITATQYWVDESTV